MPTVMAVAVVVQPDPFHFGAGEVRGGHFTVDAEEKPGTDVEITKCTP